MRITRRTATALMLAGLARPALGATPAPAVKIPTRGFALPGWLADASRAPAPGLLAALRAVGFETIRLPVAPTYVEPATLAGIAAVLRIVTDLGFNAIVDLHLAGDLDPDQIRLTWDLLGPVLADTSPEQVYAELLNEPPMEPLAWRALRNRLAGVIRKRAPHHTLIWGPARYQGIWELDATGPLDDPNSIVAVHYYNPMGFTHQCENWDDGPLARFHDLPFPASRGSDAVVALAATLDASDRKLLADMLETDWTVADIGREIGSVARWARAHDTHAMIGEFGVLQFCVDAASRRRWVNAVRTAAEANGIGWTYWEADQGFGFLADRTSAAGMDTAMVEALLA